MRLEAYEHVVEFLQDSVELSDDQKSYAALQSSLLSTQLALEAGYSQRSSQLEVA